MKRLIMDLDNTITLTEDGDYKNAKPIASVIEKLKEYKAQGFEIIISSSRNMRTVSYTHLTLTTTISTTRSRMSK